jgi:hypothetical protein
MRVIAMISVVAVLAACGGGEGGGNSKNELAAKACDAFAKAQLEDKTYTLDQAALAASMADAGEGTNFLHGPIIVEPGRASESKQTLECTVRFVAGKEQPDVLKAQFIW